MALMSIGLEERRHVLDLAVEQLLHASPVPSCIVLGPDHRCALVNASFGELLPQGVMLRGGQITEDKLGPVAHTVGICLDSVYTTGQPRRIGPVVLGQRDQPQRYFDLAFGALRDESEHVIGVLLQANDVSAYIAAPEPSSPTPSTCIQADASLRHNVGYGQTLTHLYHTMMDHYPDGAIFFFDHDLRYSVARGTGLMQAGITSDMFEGKTIWEIWPAEIAERDAPVLQAALNGQVTTVEVRHGDMTVEVRTLPVRDERGVVVGGMVVTQHITERKRIEDALRESEARFRQLAENINEVFWLHDVRSGRILYVSPAYDMLTGRDRTLVLSGAATLTESVHPDDLDVVVAASEEGIDRAFDEEFRIVRPDGTVRWVHACMFPIRDADGVAYRLAGVAEDVTTRKQAEEALRQRAMYDPLTQLPNRALLYDRLERNNARAKRYPDCRSALLFLDLDRFKTINDTLGHAAGDELLSEVARRLELCVRPGDTIARLGGDEFVILLDDIEDEPVAVMIAERILAALGAVIRLDEHDVHTGASIGIALSSVHVDPKTFLHHADVAMYAAKQQGRGRYTVYDPMLHESSLINARVARALAP